MFIVGFVSENSTGSTLEHMLAEIRAPRKSIPEKELSSIPDPFIETSKDQNRTIVKKTEKQRDFQLSGIMNKRAYINGMWYKEGDTVSGFILGYIGVKEVILIHEKQTKHLFLHKQVQGLIRIKEGGQ